MRHWTPEECPQGSAWTRPGLPWGSALPVAMVTSVPLCCLGLGSYSRSWRKTAIPEIPASEALFLRLWIRGSDVHPPCSLSTALSIKVTAILKSQVIRTFCLSGFISSRGGLSVSLVCFPAGLKLFQCHETVFEVILMTNTLCKFGKTLHSHSITKHWQMQF